jgi:hypothetical protein
MHDGKTDYEKVTRVGWLFPGFRLFITACLADNMQPSTIVLQNHLRAKTLGQSPSREFCDGQFRSSAITVTDSLHSVSFTPVLWPVWIRAIPGAWME